MQHFFFLFKKEMEKDLLRQQLSEQNFQRSSTIPEQLRLMPSIAEETPKQRTNKIPDMSNETLYRRITQTEIAPDTYPTTKDNNVLSDFQKEKKHKEFFSQQNEKKFKTNEPTYKSSYHQYLVPQENKNE